MTQNEPPPSSGGPDPSRSGPATPWEQAAEIFAAALEHPAAGRRAWLAGLTGINEKVRLEVASLLEADESARGFLTPGEISLPDFHGSADVESEAPTGGPGGGDPQGAIGRGIGHVVHDQPARGRIAASGGIPHEEI